MEPLEIFRDQARAAADGGIYWKRCRADKISGPKVGYSPVNQVFQLVL